MRIKANGWGIGIYTLIIAIGAGIAVNLTREQWAYWVQAIGSIGAIIGSFALARYQAKAGDRARAIEKVETSFLFANVGVRIADDVCRCLDDTRGKMEDKLRKRSIGAERLSQLLIALQSYAAKDLPPRVLSEILILQREVAFTLTAIRELGPRRATALRIENAEKRTSAVFKSFDRLRELQNGYEKKLTAIKAQ